MRGAKGGRHHPTTPAYKAGALGSGLQPLGAFELATVALMGAAPCGALGPQSHVNCLTDGVCRRLSGLRTAGSLPAWVWAALDNLLQFPQRNIKIAKMESPTVQSLHLTC